MLSWCGFMIWWIAVKNLASSSFFVFAERIIVLAVVFPENDFYALPKYLKRNSKIRTELIIALAI